MLFRYSGEFAVPHETTWSESIEVMARFAAMVSTDPDFDLGPVTLDRVGFRAVPFGLQSDALDRFNHDLLRRVNATGEVRLEARTIGRQLMLFVTSSAIGTPWGDADRAWEVINDEFRGLLVDSSEHLLRWEFGD